MRLNKKAQALVEFVLILPIIILLLFGFIDIGRIMLVKSEIENKVVDIIPMIRRDNKTNIEVEKHLQSNFSYQIDLDIVDNGETFTMKASAKVDFITPGFNNILGKLREVSVKRVAVYES